MVDPTAKKRLGAVNQFSLSLPAPHENPAMQHLVDENPSPRDSLRCQALLLQPFAAVLYFPYLKTPCLCELRF
jgi:hypothetical protein